MITTNNNIVLGSKSPRRQSLLKFIVNDFKIRTSDINEEYCSKNADDIVEEISEKKSKSIKIQKEEILITSDTMVFYENYKLGKPRNKDEAFKMLSMLSGKKHYVYTGITFRTLSNITTFNEKTEVYFRKLDEQIIDYYIENFNVYDKAGAYGIQDFGAVLVEKINGDYYNIMGFPISKIYYNLIDFMRGDGIEYRIITKGKIT
ncbi:septum formation protein [Oceanotoga teriensis]|uniref:dTTP/UTP pyrophosphatase n=1 Tax=Oceanotoga teriensis TaxID=515440 RepID=A0AA45HIY9_9BACT|nr:Maf family protein [Oceanotoga teriensis]PWJ95243.1 septum formation protein [Oceanotoga teriensis]